MFLVSYEKLVAAVSNAGGAGSFPAANYRTIDEFETALNQVRQLTQNPFGVNIVLDRERNPLWREQFDLSLDHKVSFLITSLGLPRSIIPLAKKSGTLLFADVINLRQACLLEKLGADALIAVVQGAGGHAGPISPFALIPQLASHCSIPIIAAGGIATGRQMAAAMLLGADGVSIGTRFLASDESSASDSYKQAVVETDPSNIIYSNEVSGIHGNWIRSSYESFLEGKPERKKKWKDIWSAGHCCAQIDRVESVQEIMDEIIQEYRQISPLN